MNDFFSTVRWCLNLSWKSSKFYTIVRVVIDITTPIIAIIMAFAGKLILDLLSGTGIWQSEINDAQEQTTSIEAFFSGLSLETGVLLLVLFLGIITLFYMVSQKISQYSQSMQSDMISNVISIEMMKRVTNADIEYFDNPEYYDRLNSATKDSFVVSHIIWYVLSLVSTTVSFVGVFLVLLTASPIFGILMVLAAIPASIAAARYTKMIYMLSLEQVNEHRQMQYCQNIASHKGYAQDVRLFGAGEKLVNKYGRIWRSMFDKKRKLTRIRATLTSILECLPEFVMVYIGASIAFGVLSGTNTVGDYMLFTGLATQLWRSINGFTMSGLQIYDNKLKIENIKKLDTFENNVQDSGANDLERIDSIVFENVCFKYPGSSSYALENINFYMQKNEKVALVGINGSGKSTLIKLLLRMYDPCSGVIKINNRDIKEYRLQDLRNNFSVYFQEMLNLNFNLRENFEISDDLWDEEKAQTSLKSAFADDINKKLSRGMETSITRLFDDAGIELSGGQQQKLALARTFYRRHTALILDEPASNLDPLAEHEIFENLKSLTTGKMTIFTSHRLSNAVLADRIIVIENGRIIEDGTQDELMKNKGRYAELFGYQQERYQVM